MKTQTQQKPLTKAQELFGKDFRNVAIINERPEGMNFQYYKKLRRAQTQAIKRVLH